MTTRFLAPAVLALFSLGFVACGGGGGDSTPAPNPSPGPGTGGGSSAGGAGGESGGTTSAGGSATGGTSAGGSSSMGTDVAGCTADTAEDHTGDATFTVMFGSGNNYSPKCIKVKVGTIVTLPGSSIHPLAGMTTVGTQPNPIDTAAGSTGAKMSTDVTFDTAGVYGFYCKNHGSDGGTTSMVGGVYVELRGGASSTRSRASYVDPCDPPSRLR